MKKSYVRSILVSAMSLPVTILLTAASPVPVQPAGPIDVRYCGIGFQGAKRDFAAANPNLTRIFSDPAASSKVNNLIFAKLKEVSRNMNLSMETGVGSTLVLAHLLTYESITPQAYSDPRDGKKYWAVMYSVGVNTILFDPESRKIRKIVPAIITYSERTPVAPIIGKPAMAFNKMFDEIKSPDTASGMWVKSLGELDYAAQESYFSVRPVKLSADARAELQAGLAADRGQTVGGFIKRVTTQNEAILANVFRKPVVPVNLDNNGQSIDSPNFAAVMPNCFSSDQSLELPEPNYVMQVSIEKLSSGKFEHRLGADAGQKAGELFQIEQGFGGRYQVQFLLPGEKEEIIDDRTFGFSRSIRFSRPTDINTFDQYSKLTVNFIGEALLAYAAQSKPWVKANISASIDDKKLRDAGKITKDWKDRIGKRFGIAPPPKAELQDDEK